MAKKNEITEEEIINLPTTVMYWEKRIQLAEEQLHAAFEDIRVKVERIAVMRQKLANQKALHSDYYAKLAEKKAAENFQRNKKKIKAWREQYVINPNFPATGKNIRKTPRDKNSTIPR